MSYYLKQQATNNFPAKLLHTPSQLKLHILKEMSLQRLADLSALNGGLYIIHQLVSPILNCPFQKV